MTMIELLVVVAVVAILAAIAIPSYSAYVIRGQRAAAKAALQQAAQYLERNYTTTGCYGFTGACTGGTAIAVPIPNYAPTDGGQYTYILTVTYPDAQRFQLAAAPCGSSTTSCTDPNSNGSFTDQTCGALLLDNTGQQAVDKSGAGTWASPDTTSTDLATCWQR